MDEPQLVKLFRTLAVISAISYLLFVFSPWLVGTQLTPETEDILSWSGYGAILPLPDKVFWLLVLIWTMTTIGLCQFQPHARWLFAALTGFSLVLTLLGGMSTLTAWQNFLGSITTLLDGAVLALAYFSPLKERFHGSANLPSPNVKQ